MKALVAFAMITAMIVPASAAKDQPRELTKAGLVTRCAITYHETPFVRTSPNGKIIGRLTTGDDVKVTEQKGSWILVTGLHTPKGHSEQTLTGWIPEATVFHCGESED
jgi:hypothetical protein